MSFTITKLFRLFDLMTFCSAFTQPVTQATFYICTIDKYVFLTILYYNVLNS